MVLNSCGVLVSVGAGAGKSGGPCLKLEKAPGIGSHGFEATIVFERCEASHRKEFEVSWLPDGKTLHMAEIDDTQITRTQIRVDEMPVPQGCRVIVQIVLRDVLEPGKEGPPRTVRVVIISGEIVSFEGTACEYEATAAAV